MYEARKSKDYRSAFYKMLKYGKASLLEEERNILQTGNALGNGRNISELRFTSDAASAGAAIPQITSDMVIQKMLIISAVYPFISKYNLKGNLKIPYENVFGDAAWTSEGTVVNPGSDSLGSLSLSAYDLIKTVQVSRVVACTCFLITIGVRAKNNTIYKYTGIIKCGDCGKNLVTVSQVRKNGRKKCCVCSTYNKYGKAYCLGHTISHDDLDGIVFKEIEALYKSGLLKMDNLDKSLEERQQFNKDNIKVIDRLQTAIHAKKGEIKNYSKQLAKGLINEELFLEMTGESSTELEKLERQLVEAESVRELRDNEKEKVASALDILKEIIDKKELTHADLAMLIDKIVVYDRKGEGLDIEVEWNTPFMVINNQALAECYRWPPCFC